MGKKLILATALLALLGGAAAGGLYYVGQQAEARFDATLKHLSGPPTVTLKKTRYARQWFGAEAESAVEIVAGGRKLVVPLKHTIQYAPLASGLAEVRTEVFVPAHFKPMADTMFKGASPLTATTVLKYDGTEVTDFESPAFALTEPMVVEWQGIKGTLTGQGANLVMNAKGPGLKVATPLVNVTLKDLGLKADVTRGADGLWLGTGGLQLARVELDSALLPAMTAEGLRMDSATWEQAAGLLRSHAAFDLQRLTVQEMVFTKLGYEVEMNNLDRAVMAKLSKAMEPFAPKPGEPPAELIGTMINTLPPFLKRSPALNVKRMTAVTPWGDFKATAHAVFDGKSELPPQPLLWLTKVQVEARADLSAGLLRWMVEQQMKERARLISEMGAQPLEAARAEQLALELAALRLTRLEQTGALVRNGDRYTIDLRIAEGAVTVNGKDVQEMAALLE